MVGCKIRKHIKRSHIRLRFFHAQLHGNMIADYWSPNALASISVYPSRSGAVTSTV